LTVDFTLRAASAENQGKRGRDMSLTFDRLLRFSSTDHRSKGRERGRQVSLPAGRGVRRGSSAENGKARGKQRRDASRADRRAASVAATVDALKVAQEMAAKRATVAQEDIDRLHVVADTGLAVGHGMVCVRLDSQEDLQEGDLVDFHTVKTKRQEKEDKLELRRAAEADARKSRRWNRRERTEAPEGSVTAESNLESDVPVEKSAPEVEAITAVSEDKVQVEGTVEGVQPVRETVVGEAHPLDTTEAGEMAASPAVEVKADIDEELPEFTAETTAPAIVDTGAEATVETTAPEAKLQEPEAPKRALINLVALRESVAREKNGVRQDSEREAVDSELPVRCEVECGRGEIFDEEAEEAEAAEVAEAEAAEVEVAEVEPAQAVVEEARFEYPAPELDDEERPQDQERLDAEEVHDEDEGTYEEGDEVMCAEGSQDGHNDSQTGVSHGADEDVPEDGNYEGSEGFGCGEEIFDDEESGPDEGTADPNQASDDGEARTAKEVPVLAPRQEREHEWVPQLPHLLMAMRSHSREGCGQAESQHPEVPAATSFGGFPLGVSAVSEQSPKPSKEISEIWERPAPLSHHHENPPPFPAPKPKRVIGPHGPPPPYKPPSLATPWTEGDDQPRPEVQAPTNSRRRRQREKEREREKELEKETHAPAPGLGAVRAAPGLEHPGKGRKGWPAKGGKGASWEDDQEYSEHFQKPPRRAQTQSDDDRPPVRARRAPVPDKGSEKGEKGGKGRGTCTGAHGNSSQKESDVQDAAAKGGRKTPAPRQWRVRGRGPKT